MMEPRRHPRHSIALLASFAAGMLFAVGLALGGMTQPSKVVGFLDVFGAWDPSLVFVMAGAVAVFAVVHRRFIRRNTPLLAAVAQLPSRRDLDAKLVVGSGLFGIGWGLAGYCPGPAITSLATSSLATLTFVASMALGMLLVELSRSLAARTSRVRDQQTGAQSERGVRL